MMRQREHDVTCVYVDFHAHFLRIKRAALAGRSLKSGVWVAYRFAQNPKCAVCPGSIMAL
jgi:hypothetical protein